MDARTRPGAGAVVVLLISSLTVGCDDVSVNVLPVVALEVSPDEVTVFEGEERTLSVVLRGPGGEVLSGRSIRWESDDPSVASVNGEGRIRGESAGSTAIRASSENANASVAVTVVEGPAIGVPTNRVELRGPAGQSSPAQVTLPIENTGGGSLTGLAVSVSIEDVDGPPWLEATLSGTAAPTTLRVRARFDGLEPGVYRGEVTLTANLARNSPQVIEVEFEVEEPPPEVDLTPSSVAFTAVAGSREPASQVVTIVNVGGGVLTSLEVSIEVLDGGPEGWLEAGLDGSTAPTTLTLQALARNLGPGIYRAEVEVSSSVPGTRSAVVRVDFNVSASVGPSIDGG